MQAFESDLVKCLAVPDAGGIVLYPTDAGWALGCDATHEAAVQRLVNIVHTEMPPGIVVLMAEERDVLQYVAAPDLALFDFLETQTRPTTVLFDNGIHLADGVLAADGSVAVRLVKDSFCRALIKRLRKPIVAVDVEQPATPGFAHISDAIKNHADYIVQWRQQEPTTRQATQSICWKDGEAVFIQS